MLMLFATDGGKKGTRPSGCAARYAQYTRRTPVGCIRLTIVQPIPSAAPSSRSGGRRLTIHENCEARYADEPPWPKTPIRYGLSALSLSPRERRVECMAD